MTMRDLDTVGESWLYLRSAQLITITLRYR